MMKNILKTYHDRTNPKEMEKVVKNSLEKHSSQLFNLLNAVYNQNKDKISKIELQKKLMNIVKHSNYGKSGYFWVNDMNYKMIMHPIKPQFDGKIFKNTPKVPFVELGVNAIKKSGKDYAYIKYKFYNPKTGKYGEKLSIVMLYKPWGMGYRNRCLCKGYSVYY